MRRRFLLGAVLLGVAFSQGAYAKDKVLMTIDGKDIMKSEFEYLYEKNSKQQIEKNTVDEYLDMFILYKQKVVDAEAAGIDTTAAFVNEFMGYQNQLIQPYLEDQTVLDEMVKQYYENLKEDVDISYIVFSLNNGRDKTITKQKLFADSIYNLLVDGADFGEMAYKYSIDRSTKMNKGHLGFVKSGTMPYEIEDAVYGTPIGEVSKPVESIGGFYIIKPQGRRPAIGKVNVRHILKLFPRGATEEERLVVKAKMDSVYALIKGGADFADMAKRESDDPGSASKGGELPWFGEGEMVAPFQKVSFDLGKGEISEPFATVYGYHIVEKLDERNGVAPYEDMVEPIKAAIMGDERSKKPFLAKLEFFKEHYKLTFNDETLKLILTKVEEFGGFNAEMRKWMCSSNDMIYSYGDSGFKVKDLYEITKNEKDADVDDATLMFRYIVIQLEDKLIIDYAKKQVPMEHAEYRNLINEYRDGMLLFEISNQKVWEGAAQDIEDLNAYFEANRDKYKWSAPKYKGLLIQVKNDSVAAAVKDELTKVSGDSVMNHLKSKFNGFIRVNKVIAGKGDNKLVDKEVFGVEDAEVVPNNVYPISMVGNGAIIDAPECAMDVRGSILADYQAVLEARWVEELKGKYSVKINKKVLKSIK